MRDVRFPTDFGAPEYPHPADGHDPLVSTSEHVQLIRALEGLGWPSAASAELAHGAHIVQYERRSTIFHGGETADLLYILLHGEAKLLFDAVHASSLLVSIACAGQMLGMFAPDTDAPSKTSPEQLFTARALSHCDVAIIPTARAVELLRHLPAEQLVHVLEHNHEQWMHLCCRLLRFLTMGVRSRLTHAIGEIADSFGVPDGSGRRIPLRLSHEDLAALVGASRPMVSKHLKELGIEGLLTKRQGRYFVLPSAGDHSPSDGSGPLPEDADHDGHLDTDLADQAETG